MSLLEQQHVLARLYTDPAFRKEFYAKPREIGQELGLSESEIEELSEAAREEVRRFSDSLGWKRLREVEKLIPSTRDLMGEDFERTFFDFARSFNPQGIKKHYEDAVEFCRSVQSKDNISAIIKSAARFESTRLTFFNESRTFAFCRLRPGILSFALWLRVGGRVFHFTV